ncbi:MAG TPA: DUF1559 domain-containing protein [Chthonomonadaceae bacterium]|nr:DUF1559 domain-containing protein [Chthonomonadaceae bacterium]
MSTSPRKPVQGFTLIELLVVIAIIAILAAILFPVFAQAREKARAISCISNEKQVSLAILQYVQDYDENMPAGNEPTTWSAGLTGLGWFGECYPYIKNAQVGKCPDDTTANVAATASTPALYASSYAINFNIPQSAPALAAMTAPASTVLIAECIHDASELSTPMEYSGLGSVTGHTMSASGNGLNIVCDYYGLPCTPANATAVYDTGVMGSYKNAPAPNPPNILVNKIDGRHTAGSNFALGDGHAKFFRPDAVSVGANAVASTDPRNPAASPVSTAAGTSNGVFAVTFSTN